MIFFFPKINKILQTAKPVLLQLKQEVGLAFEYP
jgi:hypothetical protein